MNTPRTYPYKLFRHIFDCVALCGGNGDFNFLFQGKKPLWTVCIVLILNDQLIFLLSSVGKTVDALLLQQNFQKVLSTTVHIGHGMNQNQLYGGTGLIARDLSKEFDIVDYSIKLLDIENSLQLHGLKKSTMNYQ